ncbi:UNVERIFIED_CONTAM: Retrovirus-related Pol polyprotein from transposon RE1 [Sesamum radiatum]|uniref:Retrovirus-related Pol polyprotein from transposon RE1 n=1 Tax=Sesamum radiatum TaxID=300843 RepID=A0AAW2M1T8_SESRA
MDIPTKHKSQAVPLLETYLQMVQTQFDAKEPSTFSQAQQHAEWREAMNHELTALENNHTWELTTLPRARELLAQNGFISIASAYSWPIHQLDINNAFLHGYLDEAVYMTPPEGYEAPSGMVSHGFLALLVYVDDVLITGTSDTLIQNVKSYLDRLFTIKDLGYVKYFLGLEVARSSDGLSVSQHKYICDIVTELHLQDAKTCTTPLPSGLKFSANEGALLQEPDRIHFSLVLSRMPIGRRVLIVGEAEYRAMATTVCELLWITYILKDFQVPLTTPVPFWCDNQAALHITANPVFHERTKHLDIDCHIVRINIKRGLFLPDTLLVICNLLMLLPRFFLLLLLLSLVSSWAWSPYPMLQLKGGVSSILRETEVQT